MKNRFVIVALILIFPLMLLAQVKKTVAKDKPPTQSEIDKMMEAEMKGMSAEEKAEMRKMMKDIMPALQEHNNTIANYPEFASNKQLIPKRDAARIAAMSKKKLVQADMAAYATSLYNKLIAKGDAAEIALAKKIIAQNPKADAIGGAAVLCMLQGHPQAALALSMKAVQTDPSNANWQNNMASLLTQYGYPEQAIPVLQKLKTQFPQNSTVLNNLGQAWLGLGEIDSADTNIRWAGGLNPNHPEAKETEGVIEEINGNTEKATDDYIKAMENAINPFTEKLIKNNNGQASLDKMDFEKIKRSLTIYEYFPKDWIRIPILSDKVSAYENDMRIKNGYDKMFEALEAKIDAMKEASSAEVEALLEKGENEFAKTMADESIKGLNVMSKTAVIVQMVLQAYLQQWMQEFVTQSSNLMEKINAQRKVMTASGKDDKCPDFDRKNNEFMAYANPLIRNFHAKKVEEFRMWSNAFCTWIWYIAGNPKNTILTACISWTAAITEMYESAINNQYAIQKSCVNQNGDGISNIPVPAIPNFTCPTNVTIPIGAEWQQLNNETRNFNNNVSATKNNVTSPIPNSSIGFGLGSDHIAESGRSPFIKTANGSISPGMINDDGLTPLSKIPLDDLTPLSKIPLDELTPLSKIDELTPLPDLRKNKMAKALLKKMMTADCKNINKYKYKPPVFIVGIGELVFEDPVEFEVGIGEIEFEEDSKKISELKEEGDVTYVTYDDGSAVVFMEDGSILEIDAPLNSEKEAIKSTTIKPKPVTKEAGLKNKAYVEMKDAKSHFDAHGFQPSISSGIQAPGTFAPIKDLFK